MADRIAVVRAGRIAQVDTPSRLYTRPVDAYVAAIFGEINRLPGRIEGGRIATAIWDWPLDRPLEAGPGELVFRPEALGLEPEAPDLVRAVVKEARMLGRSSVVRLEAERRDGAGWEPLNAQLPGTALPEAGARFGLRLDPRLAFVFPRAPE